MSRLQKVVVVGCCAVLAFDGLAALASIAFHFPYARASVGSYLLYLAIGFQAARTRHAQRIRAAAIAGAAGGLVDASLGWWIASAIGADATFRLLTASSWLLTAVFVMIFSTIVACLGGAVGAYRQDPGRREA